MSEYPEFLMIVSCVIMTLDTDHDTLCSTPAPLSNCALHTSINTHAHARAQPAHWARIILK